mmetsp:Transcript_4106/g.12761  ORF Transcript_4106/g.12761 Transcript_4106/m.12761 type:complete len:200 (+) Transcript_4106:1076-1675(+)
MTTHLAARWALTPSARILTQSAGRAAATCPRLHSTSSLSTSTLARCARASDCPCCASAPTASHRSPSHSTCPRSTRCSTVVRPASATRRVLRGSRAGSRSTPLSKPTCSAGRSERTCGLRPSTAWSPSRSSSRAARVAASGAAPSTRTTALSSPCCTTPSMAAASSSSLMRRDLTRGRLPPSTWASSTRGTCTRAGLPA